MDVDPPKNGINRYWSIPTLCIYTQHTLIWFSRHIPPRRRSLACATRPKLERSDGDFTNKVMVSYGEDMWTSNDYGIWMNMKWIWYMIFFFKQNWIYGYGGIVMGIWWGHSFFFDGTCGILCKVKQQSWKFMGGIQPPPHFWGILWGYHGSYTAI